MKLEELRHHLLALTPAEKTEAVRLLVQSLSNTWPGIEKTPGIVSGDACIAGARIPVWDLGNRDSKPQFLNPLLDLVFPVVFS